ncbi:hypothetical protein [Psychrobacter pygoscelis]|nr:hypothetical protein [Psychrobacter pygoscelis]
MIESHTLNAAHSKVMLSNTAKSKAHGIKNSVLGDAYLKPKPYQIA